MKGSGYTQTDKEGHTITSIDGYRAYLIIVDHHSRFTWVFLTKSKAPPVEIVTTFLKQHGQQSLQHKLSALTREANYGTVKRSGNVSFRLATYLNQLLQGRLRRTASQSAQTLPSVSWYDASYTPLPSDRNSGPLPCYTRCI